MIAFCAFKPPKAIHPSVTMAALHTLPKELRDTIIEHVCWSNPIISHDGSRLQKRFAENHQRTKSGNWLYWIDKPQNLCSPAWGLVHTNKLLRSDIFGHYARTKDNIYVVDLEVFYGGNAQATVIKMPCIKTDAISVLEIQVRKHWPTYQILHKDELQLSHVHSNSVTWDEYDPQTEFICEAIHAVILRFLEPEDIEAYKNPRLSQSIYRRCLIGNWKFQTPVVFHTRSIRTVRIVRNDIDMYPSNVDIPAPRPRAFLPIESTYVLRPELKRVFGKLLACIDCFMREASQQNRLVFCGRVGRIIIRDHDDEKIWDLGSYLDEMDYGLGVFLDNDKLTAQRLRVCRGLSQHRDLRSLLRIN